MRLARLEERRASPSGTRRCSNSSVGPVWVAVIRLCAKSKESRSTPWTSCSAILIRFSSDGQSIFGTAKTLWVVVMSFSSSVNAKAYTAAWLTAGVALALGIDEPISLGMHKLLATFSCFSVA